ncbi:MAG: mechanosensitive ion channel [Proteobacteria bacterium]|nr:mechanosensitive ion channel [Pseudomonadota bacterium]
MFNMTTLQQWFNEYGLKIIIAAIILVVAHFAAKAVKWSIAKAIDRIPFFARRDSAGPGGAKPMVDVGERIGEVGYWLVWLLGLMAALNELGGPWASSIIAPLNTMVQGFLLYLPQVVGAGLIFFIGFVLATIVRRMVEATVEAVELDRRLVDAGVTATPRGPGLARLLGILVFTLIIIPVAIAALGVLNIRAISDPATQMLQNILGAIPNVIGAALIIFIAYMVGRWIAVLTEEGLKSIGFDDIINQLASAEPIKVAMEKMDPTPGVDTIDFKKFPPSRMVGTAVLIGIILFASVEAARQLGFGAMAVMLSQIVDLAGRLLFGIIIIAFGVLLANILAAAVGKGGAQSDIMSIAVRWGVIILSTAVGLSFMGLANNIIALAFGLILGAVAVAVAIAFGIGGREAAKKMLDRWTA